MSEDWRELNRAWWDHGLGEVVSSVIHAGPAVEHVQELDYTLFPRWPFLEPDPEAPGVYRMPADRPAVPLMYPLRACKPE
jgi:hypothetical protein